MELFEPVSENPVFSFDFAQAVAGPLVLTGTDNNGNRVAAQIE
jgi:sulfur-oxidizing protein SoxY